MFEDLVVWVEGHGLRLLLILLSTFVLAKMGRRSARETIERLIEDRGGNKMRSDTLESVVGSTTLVTVWVVGSLMLLSELGVDIGPVLAGAGVAGVALGFGAQYVIRDFLAGLFVILEDQYRVGDIIMVGESVGEVEDLTLRKVVIRDSDGVVHHITHGEVSRVANMSQDFARANVTIGVAYDESLDQVQDVLNQIGEEMFEDEGWSAKLKDKPSFLRVEELADSVVKVIIRATTEPLSSLDVEAELRRRIKERFEEEGIEMPYPRMDIHTFSKE